MKSLYADISVFPLSGLYTYLKETSNKGMKLLYADNSFPLIRTLISGVHTQKSQIKVYN